MNSPWAEYKVVSTSIWSIQKTYQKNAAEYTTTPVLSIHAVKFPFELLSNSHLSPFKGKYYQG